MNMNHEKVRKLVWGALFAALCCVLTMVIQIPSPMNGYVNLGDCAVLLSGWVLGPVYGFAAAGIGSMLADIFSGYAHYAPATFLIKGAMAAAGAYLYHILPHRHLSSSLTARGVSAFAAEVIMVLGYFAYASLWLGKGLGAAASIPGNLVQGVFGVISAVAVAQALQRSKIIKE